MNKARSIVIADDDTVFPFGLNVLLRKLNPKYTIQIAPDGLQAIDFLRKQKADIVFMDYSMPVMGGAEAAEIIMKDFPETKIIMCSEHLKKEIIFEMLELEVHGYIFKGSKRNELEKGIEKVMTGKHYYSEEIIEIMKVSSIENQQPKRTVEEGNKLTPTEAIILILICKGYSNSEIAAMRSVDVRTVETHRNNLRIKIGAKNSRDIYRYAITRKLITSLDFFIHE